MEDEPSSSQTVSSTTYLVRSEPTLDKIFKRADISRMNESDFKLEAQEIPNKQKELDRESPERKEEYNRYIHSSKWKGIRRAILKMRGRKCERCGTIYGRMDVHHITYERFGGHERASDLLVVCAEKCHKKEDLKRECKKEAEGERRRIHTAFQTWFEKKYGDIPYGPTEADWHDFQSWLAEKEGDYYEPY